MELDSVACWRHLSAQLGCFQYQDLRLPSSSLSFFSKFLVLCLALWVLLHLLWCGATVLFQYSAEVEVKTLDLWLPSWSLIAALQLYRWEQHRFWSCFLWALLNCLSWARIKCRVCVAKSGVEKSCDVWLEGVLQCIFWNTRIAVCQGLNWLNVLFDRLIEGVVSRRWNRQRRGISRGIEIIYLYVLFQGLSKIKMFIYMAAS